MQEQSPFSIQLRRYLSMIIKIWPSLLPGLRNISDITGPPQHSLLPQKPYNTMTQQQFIETLINEMHLYIMQHDVKQQDLEDYLFDILDLLNIDQQITSSNSQVGGIRYMSRQVMKVILELQDQKTQSIDKFQKNIYNPVIQMGVGEAVEQGSQSEEDEGEDQDSDEDYEQQQQMDEQYNQENQEQKKQNKNKQKTEQQLQHQKQLQDDGWVIVKKK